jgi:hypothetical protein
MHAQVIINDIMVNVVHALFTPGERAAQADPEQLARTSLVNHGQDTKLTFRDGSIIVFKGVRRIGVVLSALSDPSPVGADISHHR